jgi:asparagine synthase (glutamine-hydrolysing)
MCGFAGMLTRGGLRRGSEEVVRRMGERLRHRGPDDDGVWTDSDAGVTLAFRRLAIIDLSPRGHQPMLSHDERLVIAFNGEIYNFLEIRAELEGAGVTFRGRSDTEVLLAAVQRWGLAEAVRRAVGMFAFALWDRERRELHLARDRFGEKPLYFGRAGDALIFGSELRALRAHPECPTEIDRDALTQLLRYGYILTPHSIFRGVRRVRPATILTWSDVAAEPLEMEYWSARQMAEEGQAEPLAGDERELVSSLDRALRDTIRQQMIADRPVGAFLSGGIDSSTVVALMQAVSARPVRTFTIGFREPEYDESRHARAVARHLGTDHTEHVVSPEETLDAIPRLPALHDEPFADSSQIPTLIVSQVTRQQVTVSLSGDGGDELFGGYTRYAFADQLWRRYSRVPRWLRHAVATGARAVPAGAWRVADRAVARWAPAVAAAEGLGQRAETTAHRLQARTRADLYRRLVSQWHDPAAAVLHGAEPPTAISDDARWPRFRDFTAAMMYVDLVTYLTDDILVKVDRASMAVGLESRAPFLDHRIAELAWRLPQALRAGGPGGKVALRRVLERYVPQALTERPKKGFAVPIDRWLRGPLRGWAEDLLAPDLLRRDGYLDAAVVRERWTGHLSGARNDHRALWHVLVFQAWLHA